MRFRKGSMLLAGAAALGMVIASSGLASAASSPVTVDQAAKGFKGLKKTAAPSPCKNDVGVTDTEIKVGSMIPTSGTSASSFSASLDGVKARIAKANAENEVGKQIKLVNVDTQGDASRNTTAAQQLVEQEKVFAIVENDLAADASAQYLYDQGIPVVGWQLGLPSFGKYPNFFGWRNSAAQDQLGNTTTRQGDAFKKLGAKKIALVAQNSANSIRSVEQVAEAVKATGGKVVYKVEDLPLGSTEFGAVAQAIKSAGADGLYTGMDLVANAALSAALNQAGVTNIVKIFPGGYDPRVLSLPGIEGAVFGLEFIPFESNPPTPGYTEFKKWMAEASPGTTLGQVSAIGWLMGEALVQGIKDAGVACPTRAAFITNLRLEKAYTGNGFFDPVDFTKEWNRPFPCAYYVQVQNKQFVPIFDGKTFCASKFLTANKKLKKQLEEAVRGGATPTTTTTVAP